MPQSASATNFGRDVRPEQAATAAPALDAQSVRDARSNLADDGATIGMDGISSLAAWPAYEGHPALPEDDGMRALRKRILSIQARDIAAVDKALLMHQLLIEGYTKSQIAASQTKARPDTPLHLLTPSRDDRSPLPRPLQTLKSWYPLGDGAAPLDLALTERDLTPTFVPVPAPDDLAEQLENMGVDDGGRRQLGCTHYRRNVKMQCAFCERWYTCRFCHDLVEDHALPRKQTKNMLCMLCGCPQPVSDTCIKCGHAAACYYCAICKLWNDDPNKSIYHCHDCDICRVGQGLGKDFFHCNKCHACISINITDSHKCIERSIDCNCPICGDYMFSSPKQVVFMQCGHSIHRECYDQHMQTSYKCPICSKSCVNMEMQFRQLDIAIMRQPMPAEYNNVRAIVSCNDCSAKSQTTYHWLGLKCSICNSYNTVQLQLLNLSSVAELIAAEVDPADPGPGPDAELATRNVQASGHPGGGMAPSADTATVRGVLSTSFSAAPAVSSLEHGGALSPSRFYDGLAQSVSPTSAMLAPEIGHATGNGAAVEDTEEGDEEGEMIDFWGRTGIGRHVRAETATNVEHEDDVDDENEWDEVEEDDDDDDDDDEDDDIFLAGHR